MVRSVLRATVIAVLLVGSAAPTRAAQGILVVQVSDLKGAPIPRVQLATKGDGSIGPPTDAAGRTRISLAAQTKPQTIVGLTIVSAPKDLVFISPWDNQVRVPPFENESQNFASVVLADRTDRALLENGKVVVSVVSKLNLSTAPKDASNQPAERRANALSQTAATLGVQPSELDRAIRAYGPRATDPYDKGMVALYAGDMANATERLTAALKQREERLEAGKRDAADAAFFLAQALYRQNQYAQAAAMYRKALAYRPGDPATTNNLALALLHTGDYVGAAPLLQLAVATIEAASGPNDPEVVFALNNVGAVLFAKGEVVAAENVFRRGLAIRQAALGAGDVRTANSMTNVASVLLAKNEDAAAESLLVAAHDAFTRALPGPDTVAETSRQQEQTAVVGAGTLGAPGLVSVRLNQAILARHRGRLDEAKATALEVLRDQTQTFGPRHPGTALALQVLAQVELAAKDAAAATDHFERAIDNRQSLIGADHPAIVESLVGLGDAAVLLGDTAKAQNAYRRAAAIRQRTFGDTDIVAAAIQKKLAALAK
jgi:tetratricopeptide (TPR) repeat protein